MYEEWMDGCCRQSRTDERKKSTDRRGEGPQHSAGVLLLLLLYYATTTGIHALIPATVILHRQLGRLHNALQSMCLSLSRPWFILVCMLTLVHYRLDTFPIPLLTARGRIVNRGEMVPGPDILLPLAHRVQSIASTGSGAFVAAILRCAEDAWEGLDQQRPHDRKTGTDHSDVDFNHAARKILA